ncbi:hypothetical protein C0Q70_06248 [Pomacea canaliculata]|uniref:Alpha-macroglobulin receptor-binding domain-containing protein n=1 Tax=Pomacea canaliculata TaxID=400727 RepID=A0A2T7PNN5_POMCA|nr:hypothetical protein C0Q70_06248 [Pomacea canaliculata]
MVERQAADGSFPEPGRVIHTDMQGGSGSGPGLTAFVLISLLENNDLPPAVNSLIEGAKLKAISYLKQNLHTITDDYLLAMTTYALTLARDPSAETAFTRLPGARHCQGGHEVLAQGDRHEYKHHPVLAEPSGSSRDVEMTAYALLSFAASNKFVEGLRCHEDTILALQALSEFARLAYSNSFNVEVAVLANGFSRNFSISQTNALVLQSADLPSIPSEVTVEATGSGLALVEIAVFINVEAEVEEPKFEMTVKLVEDTINLLRLETCARWLASGKSGMAVQEVGVPSGFEIDKDTLKSATAIKRTETQDSKLVLYFDEIGTTPVCVTMNAVRTGMVAKSKPVAVRVYDYYEPGQCVFSSSGCVSCRLC